MKKTISLLTALTFVLGFSILSDAPNKEEAFGSVSVAWSPGEGGGGGD
jgi:hypothetical protein